MLLIVEPENSSLAELSIVWTAGKMTWCVHMVHDAGLFRDWQLLWVWATIWTVLKHCELFTIFYVILLWLAAPCIIIWRLPHLIHITENIREKGGVCCVNLSARGLLYIIGWIDNICGVSFMWSSLRPVNIALYCHFRYQSGATIQFFSSEKY